jgi:hypothetical protein
VPCAPRLRPRARCNGRRARQCLEQLGVLAQREADVAGERRPHLVERLPPHERQIDGLPSQRLHRADVVAAEHRVDLVPGDAVLRRHQHAPLGVDGARRCGDEADAFELDAFAGGDAGDASEAEAGGGALDELVGGEHHRVGVELGEPSQASDIEVIGVAVADDDEVGLEGFGVDGAVRPDLQHAAVVHVLEQGVEEDAQLPGPDEPARVAEAVPLHGGGS